MDEVAAGNSPGSAQPFSKSNLYPDFTLTENNCDQEPIYRPIAIQGHGHMLVIDVSAQPALHAISSQLAGSLGYTTDVLWSEPLHNWLPESIQQLITKSGSSPHLPRSLSNSASLGGQTYQIVYYQFDGKLTIEFEPDAHTRVDEQFIRTVAQEFRQIDDLERLYAEAPRLIAEAFGYDRVMIYQFGHDQHGCVVGEHKVDKLEPFLGLHFPETDIPKIARDLFLKTKSRVIPDVSTAYADLLFNPQLGSDPPYLDLTYSQLRATSPIHIQYLKNMEVTATLTLSIVIDGKLWGLVACHHYAARRVQFEHRLIGEVTADLLAKRIYELAIEKRSLQEASSRAIESRLVEQVRMTDHYRLVILGNRSSIIDLCEADGAAIITLDQCIYSTGLAPNVEALLAIRDWLAGEGHQGVYNTGHFANDVAVSIEKHPPIGGMLAACLSGLSRSYIMWFRHPVSQTFEWAGDPDKSYSVELIQGSRELRLNPRHSFAKWQVSIEGQSLPWESTALDMAHRLHQDILKIELHHTAMLIEQRNKEFMQLTFLASHDLQEPLRTQANYFNLLSECLDANELDEVPRLVQRLSKATSRMSALVTDLLNYSSLASENKREAINLESLISEIIEVLETNIEETRATIHFEQLPTIRGDTAKLRQCLQNLVSNAIKYVAPGDAPEISIYMEKDDSFFTLNVKDNGIGIDPKYHAKIFTMFQRLHARDDYQGTGIGLAICAKAAESMGAEIGVTSAPGQGSTFWLRLHNSQII